MSAYGGKADVIADPSACLLIAKSGLKRLHNINRILALHDAGGWEPSTASRTDFALEHFKAKGVY